jgi:replication factor C subunit 3/5
VYTCTGNPHPSDIESIINSMMNDSFEVSFSHITSIKTSQGLALQDMISSIYDFLSTVELPGHARVYLLDTLASVEHRLSTGGSEKLQLTGLLGGFKGAVELVGR